MMDTPRARARGKRVKSMDEGDRISGLPDELRHQVLSFLPAMDAVRTSVLSPKWRHLWASVRCLNVHAEGFASQDSFINFVNALLLNRGSTPLESFWIRANGPDIFLDDFRDTACLWIRHALRSNIEELGIIDQWTIREFFLLEHCPFTSSYLKRLHLCYVRVNNHAIEKLFSGCPALEDLDMINCEVFATEFSSATLKSLRVDYDCFPEPGDYYFHQDIVINMPSLVSLHFGEILGGGMLSLVDVQSLITASIELYDSTFASACKALGALSNVKKLELLFQSEVEPYYSWERNEYSFESDTRLCKVVFANLTSLSLSDWCLHDKCKPPLHLLQHSRNLEDLTLKMREPRLHKHIDSSCSAAADSAAPFNCENLRKVEIICPKGDKTVGMHVTILLTKLMSPPEISIKPFSGVSWPGSIERWT